MHCPRCQHQNERGARYCSHCGRPLVQRSWRSRKALLLLIPLLLALLLASFQIHHKVQVRRLTTEVTAAEGRGDDASALALYRRLYDLTGDAVYTDNIRRLEEKMRWQAKVDATREAIREGDFRLARGNIRELMEKEEMKTIARDLKDELDKRLRSAIDEQKKRGREAVTDALLDRLLKREGDDSKATEENPPDH